MLNEWLSKITVLGKFPAKSTEMLFLVERISLDEIF